jgi:hypothetical protein
MNGIKQGRGRLLRRLAAILLRAVRGVVAVVKELNYAQRRSTELFLARDGYLIGPASPAATYQEFLARTSGRLVHEPSANSRIGGEPVVLTAADRVTGSPSGDRQPIW